MRRQWLFIAIIALIASLSFAHDVIITPKVASLQDLEAVGWALGPSVPDNANVTVTFALKLRNLALLKETLYAVSLPKSPRYGKHLTREEVEDMIAPSPRTILTMESFLHAYGIDHYRLRSSKGFLVAVMPASVAASMFEIQIHSLIHTSGRVIPFHSLQPLKVSRVVAQHVDFVYGISTRRPIIQKGPVILSSNLLGATTVTDLKKLYNVADDYNITNGKEASQAVGEFAFQWFNPNDTQQFFKKYSLNNVGRSVYKVNGTNNPAFAGVEASLDVEYIMSMGSNANTAFYYVNDGAFLDSLLDFFVALGDEADPEKVVSVSFGTDGDEPFALVDRLDVEAQALGTKGVTVMFASGDNGVGCLNGVNEPDFPNSPHILMVGATDAGTGSEISAKLSSGGFSDDYGIPDWQATQVAAYLKEAAADLPPAKQFNASGRGFPDVSAVGVNLPYVANGREGTAGGTSFSSPIFGGVLSLLNDLRISAKKSTLGFVTPLLYQISVDTPSAFNDVTTGPKNGDGTCVGFSPAKGWDPVTGLGSPNFQVLAKVINNY